MSGLADVFQKYQSLTGGTTDSATGLLSITSDQYASLLPLTFEIGGFPYDLVPKGQIWPRSFNTVLGGTSSAIYLVVSDLGIPSGSGYDFPNEYTFLYVYIPFSLTSIDHLWCLRLCYLTASASTACTTLAIKGSALPLPITHFPNVTKSLHRRGSDLFHLEYLLFMRSFPQNLELSRQGLRWLEGFPSKI